MKNVSAIIAIVFSLMAALATPIAIGIGLYDWVVVDVEFKVALWSGFKSWLYILFVGLLIGGIAQSYARS